MGHVQTWSLEISQVPLLNTVSIAVSAGKSVWKDSLLIPVCCAGLSVLILAKNAATWRRTRKSDYQGEVVSNSDVDPSNLQRSYLKRRIRSLGSITILCFRLLDLFTILALLSISLVQLFDSKLERERDARLAVQIAQCVLYGYVAIISTFALLGSTHVGRTAFIHASAILLVTWGVYMYRDVWPLATLDRTPSDAVEGPLVWTKLGLLSFSGVLIPLFSPRKYIPLYPKESLPPSAEQTVSLFSLLFYTYLETFIWRARRLSRITYEMLPPLPDYDHLRYLVGRTFPVLDPMRTKSQRHIGLLLIRVFWWELSNLAAMSITAVIGAFAAPISINQLLQYLESGRAEAPIKPWFWLALFFSGRLFKDVSDQWFIYYTTRLSVRIQAIVTELVFEHALRIRMKADTDDSSNAAESNSSTAVATPDNASQLSPEGTQDGGSAASEEDSSGEATHSATASSSTAAAPATSDSGKGKAKARPDDDASAKKGSEEAKPDSAKKDPSRHLVGRINNLVSSDLNNLENIGMSATFLIVESPFQIMLCIVFLYQILGWSALVGLVTMLITLPLPGWITKQIQGAHREKMKRTDSRVQTVTETMNVIRMIKLFGWEPRITAQLDKKREEELVAVRRSKLLTLLINACNNLIPILIMLSTFFTYTVIMKEELTASRVFSSMAVFDMLRIDLQASFWIIPQLVQAKVSLERISDFLRNTELIDEFERAREGESAEIWTNTVPEDRKGVIGIRHASFTWSKDGVPSQTPGGTRRRAFVLTIEDELIFQRGKINLIIGATGAGKTSLLMALLGEMHYIPAGPDSYVSLPREGGIAYAAQESWVQNETIKNNILFGAPYDEVRYNKVLHQCALERDLSLFDAGDETEVGEKGITLSGGQKARITLARAVYSKAEILLLDDILAALDVHTSKWIVEKCLKGDLLQGRTIILVTHNVAMVSPVAHFVVDMGSDGRILSQGSLESALARDADLLNEVKEEQEVLEKAELELDSEKPDDAAKKQAAGKLVVAEEREEGHVGWTALKLFLGNMSNRPILFWLIYVSGHVIRQSLANLQTWYLGYWASQYETHPAEEVPVQHYLSTYTMLLALDMVVFACTASYYVFGSLRAARIVHKQLVTSVLGTTLRWLDKTPTARIIARCTEDIGMLDNRVARATEIMTQVFVYMLLKVVAVLIFSPIFVIPAIFVSLASGICAHVFMKVQLSVKREMSNSKAPVLAHFGAAVSGITSVRAYGAQEAFKAEAYRRIDRYTRVAITHWNLNRWLGSRIDLIALFFATGLATYLTYASNLSASNTGFSLTMATAFSSVINQMIRVVNEFELSGNSLERIQQYLLIEQEPKPTPEGVPPAYWPASGQLEVEKLSARYSEDGPKVLREVSFEVAAGERVGIVGRTGSGKSSLTLALLRCILTEGNVRYDGLPTEKINLDALRSNITIIPQVPELLSGTLRQNLDPFSEHDDAVLNDALRSAGLFNLQDESDQSRITLDTHIAGGGANLSVGQRQILALARAIVRRSKLLILDEATSAIDYETDSIIQTSLRTELGKDVTLLTVAHRLQTIMDSDKIMVLDAGQIVEFGKPSELLKKENGLLRSLVEESGDKEHLYAMAMGASTA
ncbi:P-loop containing nucleoside triphosphate hydrolase protein [Trametes coccinea BRFM310]|uniref:p-loop containing nucleoside triphosphate hydrolase protein n=1 Tax=Trametes coccinea (strain BRFM310) TaxID=1353009 RepID=A0A1Y2IHG9_TRAC3|nr:P-loop containing nucleoside triphosphate hydrolase protein [Trametes coccinea BRFM310]